MDMLQDVNYFGTMQVAAGDADGLVSGCTPSRASCPASHLVHGASRVRRGGINAGGQRCQYEPKCTSHACLTYPIMTRLHAIPQFSLRACMFSARTPGQPKQLTTR